MSPIIGSFSSGGAFGGKGASLPPSDLIYDFTTATFTPGGGTGVSGPSLAQIRSGISGNTEWKNNTSYLNSDAGQILWTVPGDGVYEIECAGARGGNNASYTGGQGRIVRAQFTLTEGFVLRMLVGQRGNDKTNATCDTGSGGGTYVATGNVVRTSALPIIIGGGASGATVNSAGIAGQSSESGSAGQTAGGSGGAGGGQGGNGGGGGGGFYSNGAGSSSWTNQYGRGFRQGGAGGPTASDTCNGGFGGGGAGHGNCFIGSGGGGGYSGGGGGGYSNPLRGGGGGSFITTSYSRSAGNTSVGTNNGDGYIKITYIG
jgi:hypothetical protein